MQILTNRSRGVTLVELAIVLAILGILIVATISGKSLIQISRATATIQQMRDRGLAFQVFSSTYNCLPGDCALANTLIPGVAATVVGNGDGIIQIFNASAATESEISYVEEHLIKANLFNRSISPVGTGATSPTNNNLPTVLTQSKVANGFISNATSSADIYTFIGAVSGEFNGVDLPSTDVFRIIDTKIDDSIGTTGNVICIPNTTDPNAVNIETLAIAYGSSCVLASKLQN